MYTLEQSPSWTANPQPAALKKLAFTRDTTFPSGYQSEVYRLLLQSGQTILGYVDDSQQYQTEGLRWRDGQDLDVTPQVMSWCQTRASFMSQDIEIKKLYYPQFRYAFIIAMDSTSNAQVLSGLISYVIVEYPEIELKDWTLRIEDEGRYASHPFLITTMPKDFVPAKQFDIVDNIVHWL